MKAGGHELEGTEWKIKAKKRSGWKMLGKNGRENSGKKNTEGEVKWK